MPVAAALAAFTAAAQQCDSLISNAHQMNASGNQILPEVDRRQITVAAFLNLFIGWESFVEETFSAFLCGATTINGNPTTKFASPPTAAAAKSMIVGSSKYFDYGNHEKLSQITKVFFDQGAPFQPHIAAIYGRLGDLRAMRNASAHITSTTQTSLEGLALRLLGQPSAGIELYDLLTANDPNAPGSTIYTTYRDTLLTAAGMIANG